MSENYNTRHGRELKKNCKENFASDLLIQEVKNPDT